MPIRLRLALHGRAHQKVFHLVAINQRARRDGKPAELLGIYNPHVSPDQTHKTIEWSVDRIRYWLHVGAVPSKSIVKLLEMGNILKPGSIYHPPPVTPVPPRAPTSTLSQVRKRIEADGH